MKKILFLAIFSGMINAQTIQTGLPFLKLGIGAKSIAMGEAFTAVGNDHSAFFYNPATSRTSQTNEVMLMHKEWIEETSTEYLGATIIGQDLHYGFSMLSTSITDIPVRTMPGDAQGTFSSRNFAIGLSASFSLTENIDAGITGKLLYEKIFIDEASGYGIDAGVLYKMNDYWYFGASLLNIGSMNELRSEPSKLPTTFRVGTSHVYSLSSEFSALGAADILKTLGDDLIHANAGVEVMYNSLLAVRAGYQTGYEFKSYSTGFGVQYGIIKFDYAFVPFTEAFTSTHTFSLSFIL
jgi:hypothetical protein